MPNAANANAGSYTVVVSNIVATLTSAPPATLTLATNPVITGQPASQTVFLGQKAGFAVTAVGVNSKANPLRYQWYSGNYAASAAVAKATNSTLAFPVTQYTNNGSYFVIITNGYNPAATSVVVVLTVKDTNAPKVAFTSPKDGLTTNTNTVTVTGTASDNVSVGNVQVTVGTNAPQTALGTTKWTNVVTLVPGTNLITVQSVDEAGNKSLPVPPLHIIYRVTSPLTVPDQPCRSGQCHEHQRGDQRRIPGNRPEIHHPGHTGEQLLSLHQLGQWRQSRPADQLSGRHEPDLHNVHQHGSAGQFCHQPVPGRGGRL